MSINVGDTVPNISFTTMTAEGPGPIGYDLRYCSPDNGVSDIHFFTIYVSPCNDTPDVWI